MLREIAFAAGLSAMLLTSVICTAEPEKPEGSASGIEAPFRVTSTGRTVTVSAENADIRDLLMQIARKANCEMLMDPSIQGSISIQLIEVPPEKAVQRIMEIYGDKNFLVVFERSKDEMNVRSITLTRREPGLAKPAEEKFVVRYAKSGLSIEAHGVGIAALLQSIASRISEYLKFDVRVESEFPDDDYKITLRISNRTIAETLDLIASQIKPELYHVVKQRHSSGQGASKVYWEKYVLTKVNLEEQREKSEKAKAYLLESNASYNKSDYMNALSRIELADDLDPYSNEIRLMKARILIKLKSANAAIELLEGLTEEAVDCNTYFELGSLLYEGTRFEDAKRYFEHALDVCPHNAERLLVEGRLSEFAARTGYYQGIEEAFRQATSGKIEEAEDTLKRLLVKEPDGVLALEKLGLVLLQKREYAEGLRIFERLASKQPQNVTYMTILGDIYRLTGEYDVSIQQYRKAMLVNDNKEKAAILKMKIDAIERRKQERK